MIYRFAGFELDTELYELRRDGVPAAVEPQVFDVLVHLVVHRDRVVSKEELLDSVWGNRFVSESALTSRIKTARRAVGDDGQSQRLIRTIHGRGYRFMAPVDSELAPVDGEVADREVADREVADREVADRVVSDREVAAAGPSPVADETGPATAGAARGGAPDPSVPTLQVARSRRRAERLSTGAAEDSGAARPTNLFTRSAARDASEPAWPLLGRSREADLVAAAFIDGATGGVLLTGGAGVGKTRLAEECVRQAQASDVPVARVAGHPETASLPLAALAHLLPGDVAQPTGPEGELDRAVLFHRARAALEQLGGGRRVIVMVDDVDQLDELSRALLVSFLHARAVFVVATLRGGGELPEGLARLAKDGYLRRVDLSPLRSDVLEELLHHVLGAPLEQGSLAQLLQASSGNPGMLRQLVEGARDGGNLESRHGVWALRRPLAYASPTLEALVEERLGDLSAPETEAVEFLSVAGTAGLALLAGIVGEGALERLEGRGVVVVSSAGRRTEVGLAHPLFGEVVRHRLPVLRGRRIRRLLADALTASGARRRSDRIRVVAWRLEGGGDVDADLLAEAARLALLDGDDAMAERILGRVGPVDRTPEIVQLLAELHFRRGETDAVEELLAGVVVSELDDPVRAQVARRRATNLFFGRGAYFEGADLLTTTLAEISDPTARAGLEAYQVLLLAMAGAVADAIRRSDDVRLPGDGPARVELLRGRAMALAAAGRGEDALPLVEEGRARHGRLAADLTRPGLSLLLFTEVVALGELGRIDAADAAVARSLSTRADGATTNWINMARARIDLVVGRPGAARATLEPLVRASRALGHAATERWALALLACTRLLEGDRAGAAEDLARVALLEEGTRGLFHSDIDRAHAWLSAEQDGVEVAAERLEAAAADAARWGKAAFEAALLHDIARFGAPHTVAARLQELAASTQGELVVARAAHAAGAARGDVALLHDAVAGFRRCGTTLLEAEALVDLVSCLGRRGDQRAAQAARPARLLRLLASLPERIVTPALARSSESRVAQRP